ncbi:cyclic nucleotide-binding domain-containing protein [Bdellovibrio sp. HCB337]|uniref:cyclic nucleotide-gated ion channel n=1 Tax=Bdellovibrio sp. HCB337 TaxID=3394358 RepID=UPI0039A5118E
MLGMIGKQTLRVISVLGAFLVGFWIPLRLIGYLPQVEVEIFFDLLISLVAAINVFLYFKDKEHKYTTVEGWMNVGLWCDLICLMPLSLFAMMFFDTTSSYILLFNLLAARHVRHIKGFLDEFDNLQPIAYRLIPIIVMLPLLVHLVACGWIALGSGTAGVDADKVTEYIKGVYWSFTTLTTVGYGDISAKTNPQMLYACMIQFIGVGVFGYVLSNVASLIARNDAAREHHMNNLDRVELYMNTHEIPSQLRSKVRSYYHYMWHSKKGYQDDSIIEDLPVKIQSELYLHINKPILEKVPFLKDASADLIEDLMHQLEVRICVPGERIFRKGDMGDAMYFVHKGDIQIVDDDGNAIATLGEGAFFGEMALLSSSHRTRTAKASNFCELYVLTKEHFEKACLTYPEFAEHIHEVVTQRVG